MTPTLASLALLLALLPSLTFADSESREAREVEGFNRTIETVHDVDQTTPFDIDGGAYGTNVSSLSKTLTTTQESQLILGWIMKGSGDNTITQGAGQTEIWQTQPCMYSSAPEVIS